MCEALPTPPHTVPATRIPRRCAADRPSSRKARGRRIQSKISDAQHQRELRRIMTGGDARQKSQVAVE